MAFSLQNTRYEKIKSLFVSYPKFITQDFENNMKTSIEVLHFAYLWGACKEAQIVLEKYPQSCEGLFSLIMGIHTKKEDFIRLIFCFCIVMKTLCVAFWQYILPICIMFLVMIGFVKKKQIMTN